MPSLSSLFRTEEKEFPEPPNWWPGSKPEWLVWWALNQLGKEEGADFTYQSSWLGGRLQKGGAVIDFLMYHPPDLAINVTSKYFHYTTSIQKANEALQRAALESLGLTVVYIDEDDVLRNPIYYVKEALRGRDHSPFSK